MSPTVNGGTSVGWRPALIADCTTPLAYSDPEQRIDQGFKLRSGASPIAFALSLARYAIYVQYSMHYRGDCSPHGTISNRKRVLRTFRELRLRDRGRGRFRSVAFRSGCDGHGLVNARTWRRFQL